MQDNNKPKLPQIPAFSLQPPKISDNSYQLFHQKKHRMMLNGQTIYGSIKDQVDATCKDTFNKNQKIAVQSQGTDDISINLTLYCHCHRCDNWLLKREYTLHMSFHAAIVLQNLLLGDKTCSMSEKELIERNNVTHVVNAASQLTNYLQPQGLKYLKLDLADNLSEGIIKEAEQAAMWISMDMLMVEKVHHEGGKVFVHCNMGRSRSVTVVVVYLMMYCGMDLEQSLKTCKEVRPISQPNINYMEQLRNYDQKRKEEKNNNKEENKQE